MYQSTEEEEFDDNKEVIRFVNRRGTDNTMAKRKRTKEKQRSTKHTHKTKRSRNTKLTKKPEVNSGEAVRAPLVASVVLI